MKKLTIPEDVNNILSRLEANGFAAFVAGGAVRDLLLGKTPHDYDIATSALPEQIKKLFRRTIDTGVKHGTVTVVQNGTGYEVTTFRRESDYLDGRHPEQVEFVTNPKLDCQRRDFTMNAMLYHPDMGILDFYGGALDIRNQIIRCVGEPEKRFCEDALRMLRAVRFHAVLGFKIDENTKRAIKKCAVLIKKVSNERILEELNKILLSDRPDEIRVLHELGLLSYILPQLDCCFGEAQRNKYHIYDVGEHIMHAVCNTPKDLVLRWSALLHDIGKPCCSSTDKNGVIHFYGHHLESRRIAVDVLHRLRMDNNTIKEIAVLVENHDVRVDTSRPAVKRMMGRTGAELFEKLMLLQLADNSAKSDKYFPEKKARIEGCMHLFKEIIANHEPYQICQLAVNGKDLIRMGIKPGYRMGEILRRLLDDVLIEPELNKSNYLLKRVKEMKNIKR